LAQNKSAAIAPATDPQSAQRQVLSGQKPMQSGQQVISIDGVQPVQGIAPREQVAAAPHANARVKRTGKVASELNGASGLCFAPGYGYLKNTDPRCTMGAATTPEGTDLLNSYLQGPNSGTANAVNAAIATPGNTNASFSLNEQQNGYSPLGSGISPLGANNASDCMTRIGCKPRLMPVPGAQSARTATPLDFTKETQTYQLGEHSFTISHQGMVRIDSECREVLDLIWKSATARAELSGAMANSVIAQTPEARRLAQRYPDRVALKRLESRCQGELANAARADKGR
jgi:hypothetical protein